MADSKVEEYLLLVKGTKGRATADLVQKVTSEPGIFAFGEFLDALSVVQLKGTDVGSAHNLLQLFAYGDWPAYQASPSCPLNKEQERKLRQLTVMSKAENCKTLAYEELQRDLGLHNVRELEDFLITDCFYTGIVRGKLDQKQRCLHVLEVVGRDVPREELGRTMQGLAAWLAAAQNMQLTLQQNVTMAQKSAEEAEKMRTQQEQQIKRVKDNLKPEVGMGSSSQHTHCYVAYSAAS
eukprot:jgi/Astpho2/2000/e_gw1.00038.238.1_t